MLILIFFILVGSAESPAGPDDDSCVDSGSREPSPCEVDAETSSSPLPPPSNLPPSTPPLQAVGVPAPSPSGIVCRDRNSKVTVATQTGHEGPDLSFHADKMTTDHHCYECKVRYRDPKPRDLVMYLHAWRYEVATNLETFFFILP